MRSVDRVQNTSSRSGNLRIGGRGGTSSGARSHTLSNILGRSSGSDDVSNAMAVAHQQVVQASVGVGVGRSNLKIGSAHTGYAERVQHTGLRSSNSSVPLAACSAASAMDYAAIRAGLEVAGRASRRLPI